MFLTIWAHLDPFGPHRDIGKPAMLDHFWSQMVFRHKWLIKWQKNYFHQYPVDNEFWSSFDPIRISGSTSTGGLLHSLTSPLKQIRSFMQSRNYSSQKSKFLQKFSFCSSFLWNKCFVFASDGNTIFHGDTKERFPLLYIPNILWFFLQYF